MNQFSNFDTGGSSGPLLLWSVQGTDGVPPQSFYIKDENGKTAFSGADQGIVMDVDRLKTGWQVWEGDVPKWTWNPSVSQFAPKPSDDHKKGFEVRCAIGGGKTATWSQAGAGAWEALVGLVPALAEQPTGKLPLVRKVSVREERYSKGGKTAIPVLEVIKWVDRPDCLKEGVQAGIDTGDAQPAQQQAEPAPQPQTAAPAAASEDLEF